MKRLILFLLGFAFVASAAEYGHFQEQRQQTSGVTRLF